MPIYTNASRTPAVLVANRYDAVTCFPGTTLAASSSATGHAVDCVADMRRDTTWWQALNDGAANPSAYLHTLDADLGAGKAAPLSAVFLDRGHNLWGRTVSVRSGDGVSFTTLRAATVPDLTIDSTVPAGGDPYTGWCVTEEGALWTIVAEPSDAVACRVVRLAIAGAAGYVPAVTGIVAGLHVQLPQYLDTFDDDAYGRTQASATSAVGWRAADTTYSWRRGRLAMSVIGAVDFDNTLRDARKLLFNRGQPAVICFEPGRYPERAGVFTYDGTTVDAELTRVYRKTGWPVLEHLAALTPPVIAHGVTGAGALVADAVTVAPDTLLLTLGSTGSTSSVSAFSADALTPVSGLFTAGRDYYPAEGTLDTSVLRSLTFVGATRRGRVCLRDGAGAVGKRVRGHAATITSSDPAVATATISHGVHESYEVAILGTGVGTCTITVTVGPATINTVTVRVLARPAAADPTNILLDSEFPPIPTDARVRNATNGTLDSILASTIAGDVIVLPAGADFTGATRALDAIAAGTGGDRGFVYVVTPDDLTRQGYVTPFTAAQRVGRPQLRETANDEQPAFRIGHGVRGVVLGSWTCTESIGTAERYHLAELGQPSVLTSATTAAQCAGEIYAYNFGVKSGGGQNTRRGILHATSGIMLHGVWTAGIDHAGTDSQAICSWSGPGPVTLSRVQLDGVAAESLAFGGGDCPSAALQPADAFVWALTIDKGPGPDTVVNKNGIESKSLLRGTFLGLDVRGNEGGDGGQPGMVFTWKSTPYGTPGDPTIRTGEIAVLYARVAGCGLTEVLGTQPASGGEGPEPAIAVRRLLLQHCVLVHAQGAGATVFKVLRSPSTLSTAARMAGVRLDSCTILLNNVDGDPMLGLLGTPGDAIAGFAVTNCVIGGANYGIRSDTGTTGGSPLTGSAATAAYAPDADVSGNLFVDFNARVAGEMGALWSLNTYVATYTAAGFASDPRSTDDLEAYRISGTHATKGADITATKAWTLAARSVS